MLGLLYDDVDEAEKARDTARQQQKVSAEEKRAQAEAALRAELERDFKGCFNRYVRASMAITLPQWKQIPGVEVPSERELMWKDLWCTDMGVVMREYFFKVDPTREKFGYLPIMAIASKGMMCATLDSSFCERVNSCANMVCTKENSLLSRAEIDMVVTLRMNKRFMKFMRKEFPNLIKDAHPKFGMPVTVQEVMSRLTNQEGVRFVDMS